MNIKELIIKKNPALKNFLGGKKTVTETALVAFSKLSNNDGHKSSLHDEFYNACKATGKLNTNFV